MSFVPLDMDMDEDDLPPPPAASQGAASAPPLPRAEPKVPAKARFLLPRLHAANCQPGNTLYLQILGKWSHTMVVPPGYKPTRCDMRTRMQRPASLALLAEHVAILLAAVCSRASCPASLKRRWARRRRRPRCSARSRPPETAAARLSHPFLSYLIHAPRAGEPAAPAQELAARGAAAAACGGVQRRAGGAWDRRPAVGVRRRRRRPVLVLATAGAQHASACTRASAGAAHGRGRVGAVGPLWRDGVLLRGACGRLRRPAAPGRARRAQVLGDAARPLRAGPDPQSACATRAERCRARGRAGAGVRVRGGFTVRVRVRASSC